MSEEMKKEEQTTSINAFYFIWKHGRGMKKWLLLAAFALLLSVVASFLMPQVIRFTVDAVIGGDTGDIPWFLQPLWQMTQGGSVQQTLLFCAVGVVVLSMLSGIFNFVSRMSVASATEKFTKNLRDTLYRHIQHLPFKWHVDNQTGDIIQRCTSDLNVVRNFVTNQLLEVVRVVLLVAVALGLMFGMNTKLALLTSLFIPIVLCYSTVFYLLVSRRFLEADEAEGELTVAVQENLTGVRVVRAFGRERYELERFDGHNNAFTKLWIKLGHILSIYWGTGDFVTGLQIFAIVVYGTVLAVNGELGLGSFLVFVSYNQQLAWPVRSLGRVLSEMSKTGVSAARIQEILDAQEESAEPNAQKPNLRADITFENVTFAYEKQKVLNNLNFTIRKGTTFGILGATGSGKSTITYLLNRLYELEEGGGHIYFGDTEIKEIDRSYLRRNVGVVLQEPFLFSKTIEENIAIVYDKPHREEIRRSARIASVDDAISEFVNGYETVVGERGVTLSGGQKQRVAIARTLMLEAPVMVFDDSMSAVDLETDAKIRASLRENTHDTTVILISHRINTLMQADQIMVLEEGRITDIGTHAQLIQREGLYKRIYDMQSSDAEEATKGGEGE